MNDTLDTDIVVIGAGTAGANAFHEITRAGCSALLIDRGPLGTTCARVGCMPSKAVLHAGHRWAVHRELAAAGANDLQGANALWRDAMATRDALASGAAQRTRTAAGDRLLMGHARFIGPDAIAVDGRVVRARAFVIATGSRPVVPRSLAALGERVVTTDGLFAMSSLPASVGVIGLGAIGLELGLALARLGVRVVAGDLQSAPAGIADPLVREHAVERFGRELRMWLGRPVEARVAAGGVAMSSGEQTETVDLVLAALGRQPNVEALELQQAGIELDSAGRPAIDPRTLRVAGAPLFFAGDVSPDRPLLHEAADEGIIAARGAVAHVRGEQAVLPPRRTPLSIIFSDPDIASVGAPLDQLAPQRTAIGTALGSANGRSRILGATDNIVRVYVDRESGVLKGASLLASRGEHIAHLLAWAIQRGETVGSLLTLPFYHPTIEEMVQSALKDAAAQLAKQ